MNKEQLRRLRDLILEVEKLRKQTERHYRADTVKDYSRGKPKIIRIAGYTLDDRVVGKLRKKIRAINKEIEQMENWLNEVENPRVRMILRMQYIEGKTLEECAEELSVSVITVKRLIGEFWNENNGEKTDGDTPVPEQPAKE